MDSVELNMKPIRRRPWRSVVVCVVAMVMLLWAYSVRLSSHHLFWNGTAYYDSTVIYISLDGFRNDYLEREVTPCLLQLSEEGLRAQYMKPSFPSITFPNHWTLATGLYPESHGIVANEFYDPELQQFFVHKAPESSHSQWWRGEPIWMTSRLQGKKSAVIMWPGANVMEPNVFVPYTRETTAVDKMDQVLAWLDQPLEERPQSISVYIPQIDQKGHGGGPDGPQLNDVLAAMDKAVAHLVQGLEERQLMDHVHLVIVSDHGMAASDPSRMIYYDHILSNKTMAYLGPREAWPHFGFRPREDAPASAADEIFEELSAHADHYSVYTRETMPARFHYNRTARVAPVLMVPDVGYAIVHSSGVDPVTQTPYKVPKGIHGYDNEAPEMRALFIAKGPTLPSNKIVSPFYNTEVYQFLCSLLQLQPAPNNATLTIQE